MTRQARLDAPGTLHHVMVRGIEGRRIVDDEQDRKEFVARLGTVAIETATDTGSGKPYCYFVVFELGHPIVARKPRVHFGGALDHVMSRDNQGQSIFNDDGDCGRYLDFLKESQKRFCVTTRVIFWS